MNESISIPKLADDIRQIYAADPLQAEPSIETYLDSRLRSFSANERITFLEKLVGEFNGSASTTAFHSAVEDVGLSARIEYPQEIQVDQPHKY